MCKTPRHEKLWSNIMLYKHLITELWSVCWNGILGDAVKLGRGFWWARFTKSCTTMSIFYCYNQIILQWKHWETSSSSKWVWSRRGWVGNSLEGMEKEEDWQDSKRTKCLRAAGKKTHTTKIRICFKQTDLWFNLVFSFIVLKKNLFNKHKAQTKKCKQTLNVII